MTVDRSPGKTVRSVVLSLFILLSVVVIGTVGLSSVAAAETEISSCTAITTSDTYVIGADLTKDQTGNGDACIEITADDVYLDGQGHTITGGAPITNDNNGIRISGSTNVTVTNVVVKDWTELGTGIKAEDSTAVTVTDVEARGNTFGVRANGVDGFTIENIRAELNERTGVQAFSSTSGIIRNVTVVDSATISGWGGIRISGTFGGETSDILVDNVSSTSNDEDGIIVGSFTSDVTLTDVTATGNTKTGLELFTDEVTVGNVTAYDNNWSVRVDATGPVEVQSLDLGNSTAPNTTVSFAAKNVLVGENTTPPDHSSAVGIGRYFEVEEIGDGYFDATVDYQLADLGRVSEVKLYPWRFDGTDWIKYPGLAIDTGEKTVSVNVTEPGTVGIFGVAPVASYEVTPINETVVRGEPLEVELTNVTDTKGHLYENYTTIEFELPNGMVVTAGTSVDDGEGVNNLTVLEGSDTEDLAVDSYDDIETNLIGEDFINDTYDLTVAPSPIASFEVSAANETIPRGGDFFIDITNVTHVRGGTFDGYQEFWVGRPSGVAALANFSIENGSLSKPQRVMGGWVTADIDPGEYTGIEVRLNDEESINDTYAVAVKEPSVTIESEFAGVVHDDGGLEVNATWLPTRNGSVSLTVAGQTIPVTVENYNVSTTVDLSEHLDPETTTGDVTVELGKFDWAIDQPTDDVRLVHEAYDLDEGYTRWSIPQPAEIYVTDSVVDMTQWSTTETAYDDVGFDVNTGATVTDGVDFHKGLYVNAEGADERIGYDYVTPGEEGLSPGGTETITEGWNLLSSNYDISSGNQTLNLDLNTVVSLPANVSDYEGDEGIVAQDPSSFVRIGGDDVIDPYDTYWVYVDIGVESETRAISTAEYDPGERATRLEALAEET